MLTIGPVDAADIEPLRTLAQTIWQATYPSLISQAQIDYMLANRYGAPLIREQLDDREQAWRLAKWADNPVGFAHARLEERFCKLDKLYVHPDFQRRGIGLALLNEIKTFAVTQRATKFFLQVNRGNHAAIAAYQRYGFTIREACVFDIGGGFVMDDFVMEASL